MSKITNYNDGNGVTTVVWMTADFVPVEPGSDDARYVKMIASDGEMAFFHVNDEQRDLAEWNEADHPRDEDGKFTESGGGSKAATKEKLSSGKLTGSDTLHGSANDVRKITLRDKDGNEVQAIFKPSSGESWTEADMYDKVNQAYKQEHDLSTADIDAMIQEGELDSGDPEEPVRETITNRDFSYADREVAASELDEILGLGIVPPTVKRDIDGETGMVQQFVETLDSVEVDQDSVYGLAILDIATGNTDRHSGNVLVDKNRKVVAIDQGLSFPDETDYSSNYQFRPDATMGFLSENKGPMSQAMADRVKKALDTTDWESFTKKYAMNAGERAGFLRRITDLKTVFDPGYIGGNPSYGIRNVIHFMASESQLANQFDENEIKPIELRGKK